MYKITSIATLDFAQIPNAGKKVTHSQTKATVPVATEYSTLTLANMAEGMATITVTARHSDGNQVS